MQHFHRGSATRSTSPVRHEIGTRSYRPPANFHASTCPSDWYVNGRYSKCTATLWWQQRVARCRSSTATSWPSTPARTPSLFLYLSYALCYWLLRLYVCRQQSPFFQESVGDWRKDEVQWMFPSLVGDRKDIQPKNFAPVTPSWNVPLSFPPLLFLHHHPFCCLRRTWCGGVNKEVVWRRRVKGETG